MQHQPQDPAPGIRRTVIALGIAACVVFGLIGATPLGLETSMRGQPFPWHIAVAQGMADAFTYGLIVLGVFSVVPRLAARRRSRRVTAAALMGLGAVLVLAKMELLLQAKRLTLDEPIDRAVQFVFWLPGVVVFFGLTVVAAYGLRFARERRQRELEAARLETTLARARIEAMEAELDPPFLYATFRLLAERARERPAAARRLVARLGDLLRMVLERNGRSGFTLDEEMELIRAYLELESELRDGKLSTTFDLDPAAHAATVPRPGLRPLVTDLLRPVAGPAEIDISARKLAADVVVRVRLAPGAAQTGAAATHVVHLPLRAVPGRVAEAV